jgi:SAM-dependent methyltransferase
MIDDVSATPTTVSAEIHADFGGIDIYLFDQLQRGRFDQRPRVLDAGCGGGRNLVYFLRRGFEVYAADANRQAITAVQQLAGALQVPLPETRLHYGPLDSLPWPDGSLDAVICSAVLHFARDRADWSAMVHEAWRVLAPRGLFFARLATSIGLESQLSAATGRVALPDGSSRYVVDERTLLQTTAALGGTLVDPLKTTNVQNLRSMTTWVMEK